MGKNEQLFDFSETPLEYRSSRITITNVPPFDDYGDWATP